MLRRVEEAGLNAWPALQQVLLDGWVLRFSGGYTKRANSVTPLYPASLQVDPKIAYCEASYAEKGLPPIFRLTPFASPENLDHVLEERGYLRFDPTFVLGLDLSEWDSPVTTSISIQTSTLDGWMETYAMLSDSPQEKNQKHQRILERIPGQTLFATLSDEERIVACGLGVLDGGYFGLFDLFTAPEKRRLGFGTQLVNGMLRWALRGGASYAYLQVMEVNHPARSLYAWFGFQELYAYWYRVPEKPV
jgi:GNAT superfamily N-acetyltransferase